MCMYADCSCDIHTVHTLGHVPPDDPSPRRVLPCLKRLPMDELSVITEISESGNSTHTNVCSSSGGEEGGAAEKPVARERWVESGVGFEL